MTGIFITLFFKDVPFKKEVEPGKLNKVKRMDPLGILAFIPSIISLLLSLQWGGTKYEWNDTRIIVLFVLFGVFGSAWCLIQCWMQEQATVPPRLLKDRNVLGAALHAMFLGGSFFVFGYYVSRIPYHPLNEEILRKGISFLSGFKPSRKCLHPSPESATCPWWYR